MKIGAPMSRWIVDCPECGREFTHTLIGQGFERDPFASPLKPDLTASGAELKCPNCGETSTYKALDLRYRAN